MNSHVLRFPLKWKFLKSVPSLDFLPVDDFPEVAFAGRSNVGKSSLINSLIGRTLARTSNTPGRTQEINYFIPDPDLSESHSFSIVDLPGYGYAYAPRERVLVWNRLISDYLQGRRNLKRVYLLIDSRHGIKQNDLDFMNILSNFAVSYQVVLTKIDKISQMKQTEMFFSTEKQIQQQTACYPDLLKTSSEKNSGIELLKDQIIKIISI